MANVNYKLLSNGKEIRNYFHINCFAAITQLSFSEEVNEIIIYPHIRELKNFTEAQIKLWVKTLCLWGFPCRYIRKDAEYYYFSVNIKKLYSKVHLTSTLILLRYLWESECILKKYFELREQSDNKFKSMLKAHEYINGYINTNHTLRIGGKQRVTPHTEMLNRLKNSKYGVYGGYGADYVSVLWKD